MLTRNSSLGNRMRLHLKTKQKSLRKTKCIGPAKALMLEVGDWSENGLSSIKVALEIPVPPPVEGRPG